MKDLFHGPSEDVELPSSEGWVCSAGLLLGVCNGLVDIEIKFE